MVPERVNILNMSLCLRLQDSVESVHGLLGRQEELEGLLKALDQRVDHFSERSLELVNQQHYAAKQ